MDKILFTPGPLTTSLTVKQAMLHDIGSRDTSFIQLVKEIRGELLHLGHVSQEAGYESVIIQGSGTFGIESVLSSAVPRSGKLLILINGAYGERMANIARIHQIPHETLVCAEDETPDLSKTENLLASRKFSHLAIVHCETTSGIFNPVEKVGQLVKQYDVSYIVDSMSAFGAVPLNIATAHIDFLVSSSNKCIEGVPGFSFIIAKKESLTDCQGQADTLTLDLYAQWLGLENDGQFRFTPPTHALLAFSQALQELRKEGGVEGRALRYQANHHTLSNGMRRLGFRPYLHAENQGYIINSFYYPDHSAFDFQLFYKKLNDRGMVIYPGKLSKANCFRIGNIGRIFDADIQVLLLAIKEVKAEMGF
jgi:2-aminoethylphosphonate-pyruvate transaminase